MYEEQYDKELSIVVFRIKIDDLNINLLSIDTNQQLDEETSPTYFYNGIIPLSQLQIRKLY